MNKQLTKVQKAHIKVTTDIDNFINSGGKVKQCRIEDNAGYMALTKPSTRRLLSKAKVKVIRNKLNGLSGMSRITKTQELAKKYGVSYHTVRNAANGNNWTLSR